MYAYVSSFSEQIEYVPVKSVVQTEANFLHGHIWTGAQQLLWAISFPKHVARNYRDNDISKRILIEPFRKLVTDHPAAPSIQRIQLISLSTRA